MSEIQCRHHCDRRKHVESVSDLTHGFNFQKWDWMHYGEMCCTIWTVITINEIISIRGKGKIQIIPTTKECIHTNRNTCTHMYKYQILYTAQTGTVDNKNKCWHSYPWLWLKSYFVYMFICSMVVWMRARDWSNSNNDSNAHITAKWIP